MVNANDVWRQLPAGMKGESGDPGSMANKGAWVTSTLYAANDYVTHAYSGHGLSTVICKPGQGHTSSALTEPYVGANWATVWQPMAEGGVNGAGTGDMVGPASAVAHNLVSFSNTGGKTGEDSGVSRDQVNFANLVESTSAIDSDADYLKIWKASDTTYHKILARLLGRKLENIILPAQGLWPKKTLGCLPATNLETPTYKRYIAALPFATGAKSYGEIDFFLPWYYSGTPITVCFHWMTTTANAGSVCWGIQGAVFGDGDIIDVADGTAQEISDSSHVTAYAELITEPTGVLTLAGVPAGRKKCILSIYRDPAKDTLVDTAYLTGVYIDYGCLE